MRVDGEATVERAWVTDAARELAVVLLVALIGLLLAALVVLTPWYDRGAGAVVVEMSGADPTPQAVVDPAGERVRPGLRPGCYDTVTRYAAN